MADNVYVIKVELPGGEAKKSAVAKTDTDNSADKPKDEALSVNDALSTAKKVVAYSGIKMVAEKYVGHYISTVSLRTGAVEYEQRLQTVQSEVSQAVGSLASIGMGAAVGGVPGAAVAAVGVALSYASKFMDIANNARTLRLEGQLEGISQQMMRVRMGAGGSRNREQ